MNNQQILMPKGVAAWLIRNTKLSFEQISCFCNLHVMEVQHLADKEKIKGIDPILVTMEVDKEEIRRCEEDPQARLKHKQSKYNLVNKKDKKVRTYFPLAHRKNKQKAALWIMLNHPSVEDKDIKKLLDISLDTVSKLRNKTYNNYSAITPQDPVVLQLCSKAELENLINKYANKS